MLPSHIFCFMHSYHSIHPLCLYLHLLFIHAFALLILSTCLRLLVLSIFCSLLILFCFPVHLHITILSHLISCASWSTCYSFAQLPTCHFLLPFLPSYFSGFSFHQIPILFTISVFNFATLLPSPPLSSPLLPSPPPSSRTLHHHLHLIHSLLLSPPSFTHLSTSFLIFFPLFFSTLISFLLPFTYLAPHTFGPFL